MLAVRLDPELERQLSAAARARGCTKSTMIRDALRHYLQQDALIAEARRQSRLACAADAAAGEDIDAFLEALTAQLGPEGGPA